MNFVLQTFWFILELATGEKRQRLKGSGSDDGHLSKQPVHHEHLSSDNDSESYDTSSARVEEPASRRPCKRKSRSHTFFSSKKGQSDDLQGKEYKSSMLLNNLKPSFIYIIGKRLKSESDVNLTTKKLRPHYSSSENDPEISDTSYGHHKEAGRRKCIVLVECLPETKAI